VPDEDYYAEVESLVEAHLSAGKDYKWASLSAWQQELAQKHGEKGRRFGLNLMALIRFHQAPEVKVDASIKNTGTMTGVVGGLGNNVKIGDISAYTQAVDQSFSSNPQLRDALKAGADAIRGLSLQEDLKEDVLNTYAKLTTELGKPAPAPGIVKYLWSGITAVAGTLNPIIELGKLLFPIIGAAAS
jgi:hypothetical protein